MTVIQNIWNFLEIIQMFVFKICGLFILGLVVANTAIASQNVVLQSGQDKSLKLSIQNIGMNQPQTFDSILDKPQSMVKINSNQGQVQTQQQIFGQSDAKQRILKNDDEINSQKNTKQPGNTTPLKQQDRAKNEQENYVHLKREGQMQTIYKEFKANDNGYFKNENKQHITGFLKTDQAKRDFKANQNVQESKKQQNMNNNDRATKMRFKITKSFSPIINITKNTNKIDWVNSRKIPVNDNQTQTNQKKSLKTQADHMIKSKNNNDVIKQKVEQIRTHLVKPFERKSSTQFVYEFKFEYPMLENNVSSKIYRTAIDEFVAPIQISAGSAFSNRLNTQYVLLSNNIPVLQRHLKLKPGKYRIRFDWETNQPEGQLQLFWNHRLVASYKSEDQLANQEEVRVQSKQDCYKGGNILKFINNGPIFIGIDNIQVIS